MLRAPNTSTAIHAIHLRKIQYEIGPIPGLNLDYLVGRLVRYQPVIVKLKIKYIPSQKRLLGKGHKMKALHEAQP